MSAGRRSLLVIIAAATVWYGCTLALWAFQPLHDSVPVGVDYSVQPPSDLSVEVDCNTLFDSQARDDTPLPALKAQPDKAPALGFQREPCALVHGQAGTVFIVDTAVFAAVLALGGWLMWRSRKARPVAGHALIVG